MSTLSYPHKSTVLLNNKIGVLDRRCKRLELQIFWESIEPSSQSTPTRTQVLSTEDSEVRNVRNRSIANNGLFRWCFDSFNSWVWKSCINRQREGNWRGREDPLMPLVDKAMRKHETDLKEMKRNLIQSGLDKQFGYKWQKDQHAH